MSNKKWSLVTFILCSIIRIAAFSLLGSSWSNEKRFLLDVIRMVNKGSVLFSVYNNIHLFWKKIGFVGLCDSMSWTFIFFNELYRFLLRTFCFKSGKAFKISFLIVKWRIWMVKFGFWCIFKKQTGYSFPAFPNLQRILQFPGSDEDSGDCGTICGAFRPWSLSKVWNVRNQSN